MINQFTLKGEWFLPSTKDIRAHGTLTYHPNEGAHLELYGSLDGDNLLPEFKDQEIILGLTSDSKHVTLYKCSMTNSGGATLVQGGESGKPSGAYSIIYVLIGTHADTPSDLCFNRISSEIFNLGEWVGISGFKSQPTDYEKLKRYEISVEYKLPEPIEFQIDDETKGRFNFIANHPSRTWYQKSINITQRVEFQAECNIVKGIDDLLEYVFTFQNFLTLALYRSTYPLSISLSGDKHVEHYDDGKTYKKKINLFFSTINFKPNEKPKEGLEMIFCYRLIKDDFPKLIKNWFSKYELLEPAFDLVFEQFYNGNRFTVNTFLNLAQSAETFHARVHNHTRMPKSEYKEMKEEILKASPSKYHIWLNEQFNFGNNLNLHSRLTELTKKYSNEILERILGDKSEFILNVKRSRNYYTHYSDDGKKQALKGINLFYLAEKLKILLVCSFLIEIGFDINTLTSSLDNLKWKLFSHLADWRQVKKTEHS